jgi:hypothetical protein
MTEAIDPNFPITVEELQSPTGPACQIFATINANSYSTILDSSRYQDIAKYHRITYLIKESIKKRNHSVHITSDGKAEFTFVNIDGNMRKSCCISLPSVRLTMPIGGLATPTNGCPTQQLKKDHLQESEMNRRKKYIQSDAFLRSVKALKTNYEALLKQNAELFKENEALKEENEALKEENEALKARLAAYET